MPAPQDCRAPVDCRLGCRSVPACGAQPSARWIFAGGETRVAEISLIGASFSIGPTADSVGTRSEEHTSELQSLMRRSYAVFCLKKKKIKKTTSVTHNHNEMDART